jgi:hypothetical protein
MIVSESVKICESFEGEHVLYWVREYSVGATMAWGTECDELETGHIRWFVERALVALGRFWPSPPARKGSTRNGSFTERNCLGIEIVLKEHLSDLNHTRALYITGSCMQFHCDCRLR